MSKLRKRLGSVRTHLTGVGMAGLSVLGQAGSGDAAAIEPPVPPVAENSEWVFEQDGEVQDSNNPLRRPLKSSGELQPPPLEQDGVDLSEELNDMIISKPSADATAKIIFDGITEPKPEQDNTLYYILGGFAAALATGGYVGARHLFSASKKHLDKWKISIQENSPEESESSEKVSQSTNPYESNASETHSIMSNGKKVGSFCLATKETQGAKRLTLGNVNVNFKFSPGVPFQKVVAFAVMQHLLDTAKECGAEYIDIAASAKFVSKTAKKFEDVGGMTYDKQTKTYTLDIAPLIEKMHEAGQASARVNSDDGEERSL